MKLQVTNAKNGTLKVHDNAGNDIGSGDCHLEALVNISGTVVFTLNLQYGEGKREEIVFQVTAKPHPGSKS